MPIYSNIMIMPTCVTCRRSTASHEGFGSEYSKSADAQASSSVSSDPCSLSGMRSEVSTEPAGRQDEICNNCSKVVSSLQNDGVPSEPLFLF